MDQERTKAAADVSRKGSSIHPDVAYTLDALRRILGLKTYSLPREIKMKRLRASQRCGRVFILGRGPSSGWKPAR